MFAAGTRLSRFKLVNFIFVHYQQRFALHRIKCVLGILAFFGQVEVASEEWSNDLNRVWGKFQSLVIFDSLK